jgi:hypothetical protein
MTKRKSISTSYSIPKTTKDERCSIFHGKRGVKRIHVNQHMIRANNKDDEDRPIFTCKSGKDNHRGHEVHIHGPSVLVYPAKPLGCGARVWIETLSSVSIVEYTSKATNIIEVQ